MDENLDVKKIVEKIKTKISNDSNMIISAENIVQQASESNSKNAAQSRGNSLETRKIIQDFEKFDNMSKTSLNTDDSFDENLYLSSRNLINVLVVEAKYADPVSLVHFSKVIATTEAVKQLEEMFA